MVRVIKHLILFLFSTLLLTGCETTKFSNNNKKISVDEIIENRKIKKNFTKQQLYDSYGFRYILDNPFTNKGLSKRILDKDVEIIWGPGGNIFYVFEGVSEPVDCGVFTCNQGNGYIVSWHNSLEKAIASAPEKKITQTQKPSQTSSSSSSNSTTNNSSSYYDNNKYLVCYGEMTKAHKARGFHDRNRLASIKVKETICKAYAKGEIDNYEGKGL